jgi:hypothetical protein
VRLEGIGQLKNPITSSGIELLNFRLVAWCLNQLRYREPPVIVVLAVVVSVVIHSFLRVLVSSKGHVTGEICIMRVTKTT